MCKGTKIWCIVATALILIGCMIFGGAMTMLKWDFTGLSTNKYETNSYEITENYKNISVVTDTADIVFVSSENSECSVTCYEQKNAKHSVSVKDDTLVIEVVDTRKWYEFIGINFGSPKITVSIPQGEYGALSIRSDTGDVNIPKGLQFSSIDISESTGDVTSYASASGSVKVKSSTGDIRIEGISAGALDLSVSTGKVTVSDVTSDGDVTVKVSTGKAILSGITCKSVISSGDTGDLTLKNVLMSGGLSIERSTGDVSLSGCDAAEIFIETDTGDVKGTLLTEKVFIVRTDTGRINVPKTTTGGKCEITTDTGDIRIGIASE